MVKTCDGGVHSLESIERDWRNVDANLLSNQLNAILLLDRQTVFMYVR